MTDLSQIESLEAPIIHDLADRRLGVGRDFHQIKTGVLRDPQGVSRIGFTTIVAILIDQLNGGNADFVVDAGAFFDGGLGTVRTANGAGLLRT